MHDAYTTPWTFDDLPCYRSTTVLMPSTRLVYHVTDRDRQRPVRRALAGDGFIAIRHDPEDGGEPSSIATLAEVERAERPSPTRVVAALRGLARFRIDAASTSEGVELLEGEVVTETRADGQGARSLIADTRTALGRIAEQGYGIADQLDEALEQLERPSAVPDVLAALVFDDPAEHRTLLEEIDVVERLRRVEARLNTLAEQEATSSS